MVFETSNNITIEHPEKRDRHSKQCTVLHFNPNDRHSI